MEQKLASGSVDSYDPFATPLTTKSSENASMIPRSVVSDEHLIQRFKQGDMDAFSSLYERYFPGVQNRVRYVIPEADIEDVTQEVFITVVKSLHTFRGESLFSTWLRTLTNYKVAEYYRKRNRKQDPREVPMTKAELIPDESDSLPMEDRIALRRAMASMPEKYRDVVLMRFSDGMQFDEIARTTGTNLEATKSLFRRAVTALRKNLEDYHDQR
ncbi:MAG: RNA polymerase sigma factor [Chloroflexi bacterium]|nr:RNA polymerase sigma factor [Chloroflexota bacterium]